MVEGTITNTGKRIFLQRHYQPVPVVTAPTRFKAGQGTTSPTITDTDLQDAVPIYGEDIVDDCDDTTGWVGNTDTTFGDNTVTKKKGFASLEIIKSGATLTSAVATQTPPNLDITNKEFSMWLFLKDGAMLTKLALNAVDIRYGNDASNYLEWNIPSSQLSIGWNLLTHLTVGDATTVGSPTLTAMNWLEITLNTTAVGITWVAGDCMVDDIKLISAENYFKEFESGYPELDIPNIQAEIRFRLSTVQANGYLISETGLFNTDLSPLMESRDIFAPISKSDTDELLFVVKTIVE